MVVVVVWLLARCCCVEVVWALASWTPLDWIVSGVAALLDLDDDDDGGLLMVHQSISRLSALISLLLIRLPIGWMDTVVVRPSRTNRQTHPLPFQMSFHTYKHTV